MDVGKVLRLLPYNLSSTFIYNVYPSGSKSYGKDVLMIEGFVEKHARGEYANNGDEGVVDGYFPDRVADDEFVVKGKSEG